MYIIEELIKIQGPFKGKHLSTEDLEAMGKDLVRGILVYAELMIPEDLVNIHNIIKNHTPSQPKKLQDADRKKL